MHSRPAIRFLLWGICLATALFSARSAQAAAPMCDENGASRIAPAPVLPVRDIKIDTDFARPCDDAPEATVMPLGPPAAGNNAVVQDPVATEAWIKPSTTDIPIAGTSPSLLSFDASLPLSPGFRPSVFRPPRA